MWINWRNEKKEKFNSLFYERDDWSGIKSSVKLATKVVNAIKLLDSKFDKFDNLQIERRPGEM